MEEVKEELVLDLLNDMKALKKEVVMLKQEINGLKSGSNKSSLKLSIDLRVANVLHEMGIPKHLKGCMYLQDAVKGVYEDVGLMGNIVRVVYPEIANKFHTTPSCVERAIRNAIEVSWAKKGDLELKKVLFGKTMDQNKLKPTNNMFIMTMVDYLRQQDKHKQFKANA